MKNDIHRPLHRKINVILKLVERYIIICIKNVRDDVSTCTHASLKNLHLLYYAKIALKEA